MTLVPQVMTQATARIVFDRTNPEPPKGLYVLRNKGHWRHFRPNGKYDGPPAMSTALSFHRHAKNRGVYLDAGCGHSPDAAVAVKQLGFKEAIKVDLWEPYWNELGCISFRVKLERTEGPKVRFVKGDICKLTDYVERNSVDLITSSAVLDLLKESDRHLFYCEAYDVLREGGVLAVYHIPLAMGHRDWKHGVDEYERMTADGYTNFDHIHLSQSMLVLRKTADVSVSTASEAEALKPNETNSDSSKELKD